MAARPGHAKKSFTERNGAVRRRCVQSLISFDPLLARWRGFSISGLCSLCVCPSEVCTPAHRWPANEAWPGLFLCGHDMAAISRSPFLVSTGGSSLPSHRMVDLPEMAQRPRNNNTSYLRRRCFTGRLCPFSLFPFIVLPRSRVRSARF